MPCADKKRKKLFSTKTSNMKNYDPMRCFFELFSHVLSLLFYFSVSLFYTKKTHKSTECFSLLFKLLKRFKHNERLKYLTRFFSIIVLNFLFLVYSCSCRPCRGGCA